MAENTEKSPKKVMLSMVSPDYKVSFEKPTEKSGMVNGKNIVKWGNKNTFPDYLYELYETCAIHQSVVDGISLYTYGSGVEGINTDDVCNMFGHTYGDVIKKCLLDKGIFDGFALLKARTKGGSFQYQWIDMVNVRINSDFTKAYVNADGWVKSNGKNIVEYNILSAISGENESGIFIYRGEKARGIYPIPNYIGALKCLEVEREIDNYHLSSIKRNFTASMHITFIVDNIEKLSDEEKDEVEDDVNESFGGSDNASKTMVSFVDSKEKAPILARIESDKADEKYQSLNKSNKEKIFVAHKVTSSNLFGVSTEGKGFSGAEFMESFTIFNNTIIKSYQDEMARFFSKVFNTPIKFKPFVYDTSFTKSTNESDITTK